MDILVVGGAGYIGSHMVQALRAAGFGVVVVDNLSTGYRGQVRDAALEVGDIGDRGFIDAVLARWRPAAVMHFAALIEVAESVREPARYYRNNVAATQVLLDAMRAAGIDRLIFSSTAAIFGLPQRLPIDEAHPCAPINPYGRGKWMVEQMLGDYRAAYGLRAICLRYFNAAGALAEAGLGECHQPESHLIPLVLQVAAGRRADIAIYGDDYPTPDGTCVRDYIHVVDLCAAHLLALRRLLGGGEGGAFNLGNGQGFSVREVVETARQVTGHAIPCRFEPRRPGDPPQLVADATRARRELGWQPQLPQLERIIGDAWAWEQRYADWPRR